MISYFVKSCADLHKDCEKGSLCISNEFLLSKVLGYAII